MLLERSPTPSPPRTDSRRLAVARGRGGDAGPADFAGASDVVDVAEG